MISATLQGGTGNQFFQIAAAIGHAERMGTTYNLEFQHAIHYEGPFHNAEKNGALPQFKENGYEYKPIDLKMDLSLFGYYQSERYFENVADEIRRKFTPAPIVRDYCDRKYKHICEGATAIHVRRGDYLELSEYHFNLGAIYYTQAMKLILGEHTSKLVVFSDDPEFCATKFHTATLIHEDEIKDLYIMSLCKNFIIANSSYSWWAAWLGEKGGVTIAPRTWFGPKKAHLDTKDLYCKNWIVI